MVTGLKRKPSYSCPWSFGLSSGGWLHSLMCQHRFSSSTFWGSTLSLIYIDHIHRSGITLWPPAWYCVSRPFAAIAALTRWGMDSTRPLKVCCGIWHQDVSSRSFNSSTSYKILDWIEILANGGQVNTSNLLLCSSNCPWTIFALWHSALSCWKSPQPSGNTA